MEPFEMEVLAGNALFVLLCLVPLNIEEIVDVWSMYSKEFEDALNMSNSHDCGNYWMTPKKEQALLKEYLLKEEIVEEINEIFKGKRIKSLKITVEGKIYLQKLINDGIKFKCKTRLIKDKHLIIDTKCKRKKHK